MREQAGRQNGPVLQLDNELDVPQELPIGSELLIAFALGAAGWWGIVRTVQWVTG